MVRQRRYSDAELYEDEPEGPDYKPLTPEEAEAVKRPWPEPKPVPPEMVELECPSCWVTLPPRPWSEVENYPEKEIQCGLCGAIFTLGECNEAIDED